MKDSLSNKLSKQRNVTVNTTPENRNKSIYELRDLDYLDASPYNYDFVHDYLRIRCETDSSYTTDLYLLYDGYQAFCTSISRIDRDRADITTFCDRLRQAGLKIYDNDGRPFVLGIRPKD